MLQRRIALLSQVVFTLSALFWVTSHAMVVQHHGVGFPAVLWLPPHLAHAAALAVSLATWLVTRRGRLPDDSLVIIDAAHLILAMCAYAATAALSTGPLARPDLVVVLIAALLLTTRAIIVPSTPRRTLVLGVVASSAVLAVGVAAVGELRYPPGAVDETAHILVIQLLWCITAVAVSTLASHVTFGLRRQVAAAEHLGQYVLEEKIGAGGMGEVYRARHALLRRPTAIKLLPPSQSNCDAIARFEREVQQTSRLSHPNTIAIYDYGRTEDGVFYYAMEYLDGVDLERLVAANGPQPPERVVHILRQVCGSLAEAHAAGLVHRDIKPANIALCERGGVPDVVKVLDFGLVKDLDTDVPELSHRDALVGTPLYIAPEAITANGAVGPASDLYALGAVAYFLLTGTPPFSGTVIEVCSKHLHETPAPPSRRLGRPLPPGLEALVLRCLRKKPAQRPGSATALAEALADCGIAPWTGEDARRSPPMFHPPLAAPHGLRAPGMRPVRDAAGSRAPRPKAS